MELRSFPRLSAAAALSAALFCDTAAALAQEPGRLFFLPALTHPSGAAGVPSKILAEDVSGDGLPDLIVTTCDKAGTCGTVMVMLANGDGTFRPPVIVSSGDSRALIAVADVNRDRVSDVIVADSGSGDLRVLLSNGDGTVQPARVFHPALGRAAGMLPSAIATSDMNRDGMADLVLAWGGRSTSGAITVALGNGDGSFRQLPSQALNRAIPAILALDDLDMDGSVDALIGSESPPGGGTESVLVVLPGAGNGTLGPAATYPIGATRVTGLAVADVNGDGHRDTIVLDGGAGRIEVLLGRASGGLAPAHGVALADGTVPSSDIARGSLAIVDLNTDAVPDLLVSHCPGNICAAQVLTLVGNGDGSFQSPVGHGTTGPGSGVLAAADLNGDRMVDAVVASCDTAACETGALDVLLGESPAAADAHAEDSDDNGRQARSVAADPAPALAAIAAVSSPGAGAYNIKVVTDSSPDLSDLGSLIQSTTSRWASSRDKVWALFYWGHILRRQTSPVVLHGFEVTDPIRNFVDFGFTQCSTISGINQSLYEAIGLSHQFWDICNHTVSAVEYDGSFHMVDTSMSHLVTRDDGVTLASVAEAAADSARLVRERSLYSTSPNGFLTGSDTMRSLVDFTNPADGSVVAGFARAFCETGLKYRDYYYNWNSGHRYVLNLRENESYTRFYRGLGSSSSYWVGSERVSAPNPADTYEIDASNRFGLRGNGSWVYTPDLAADRWARAPYSWSNILAAGAGLRPAVAGQPGELTYKIQAANAIASQRVTLAFARTDARATAAIAVSLNHGRSWTDVGSVGAATGGAVPVVLDLRTQVSGAYEMLLRIAMRTDAAVPDGIVLTGVTIDTITQLNIKSLPTLKLGRNEVVVASGDQTDTMVLWPDLRADLWKRDAYDSANIAAQALDVPRKYTAVVYPASLLQDAYLTYRLQAPSDIGRVVYGGRLYNYNTGSYIDFLHSFDGGATWSRSYRLSSVSKPYDVVHYETVTGIPAGVRTVLVKFLIHNTSTTVSRASGMYSIRIEANHQVASGGRPIDVTLQWKEVRADRTLVSRGHRQRIDAFPFKYIINVGGSDYPVMESIRVNVEDSSDPTPFGYSDGIDRGGAKYIHTRRVDGANQAKGRPYTVSRAPSGFQSSAGASNATILTDGVVGSPVTGSYSYWWGQCWTSGADVDLQVDLGQARSVSAFRAHLFGYPGWDALKGEVQDRVEVLTSSDGAEFVSHGTLETSLWRKDVPINHMLQDDERATGWNFERRIATPVSARYVRYRMTPKRNLCVSELQVFDQVSYEPFDISIALPTASLPVMVAVPSVVGLTQSAATSALASAGLVVSTVTTVSSSTVAAGVVLAQIPGAGTSVLPGAAVDLTVSSGPPVSSVVVPSVVGLTQSAATSALASAGLVVGTVTTASSATAAAGTVMGQTPGGGTSAPAGSAVNLTVSTGPPPSTDGTEEIVVRPGVAGAVEILGGWAIVADATAAGGGRLQNANAGAAKLTTPLAAPVQAFDVVFTAEAGKAYRLWLRGKALGDSYNNDSVFVQFDGSVTAAGAPQWRLGTTSATPVILEDCSGCGLQGWGWNDNAYGAGALGPLVYFAQSGPQRMRIQTREDGLGLDQIVLSARTYLTARPGATRNDTTILPLTVTPPSTTEEIVVRPGVAGTVEILGGWAIVADATAAGGGRLQDPNAGAAKLTTPLAAPVQAFNVVFTAEAGKAYRLWLRGKALGDSYNNLSRAHWSSTFGIGKPSARDTRRAR